MATTDNLGDFLTSVANAIRSKSGSTAQINAQDFASEIENLPSGEKTNKFLQLIGGTENVSLTAQDFGDITEIRQDAFAHATNLISVVLPNTVSSIGRSAFQGCINLTNIFIPEGITQINILTFSSCRNLNSVILPTSVTNIDSSAFNSCISLIEFTIPKNVTRIGTYVFQVCSKLITLTLLPLTPPTLSSTNAISSATTSIYVPDESVDAYKQATNWSNFANIIKPLSEKESV